MWGLVSKLFARAFSWQPPISPAIFLVPQPQDLNNVRYCCPDNSLHMTFVLQRDGIDLADFLPGSDDVLVVDEHSRR